MTTFKMHLIAKWSSWWRCCLGHSKNFSDDDDDDDDDDWMKCAGVMMSYRIFKMAAIKSEIYVRVQVQ